MYRGCFAFCLTAFAMFAGFHADGQEVNLLPNAGFEKDADGDGVADGWIAQKFNFSRETLEDVRAYVENLPPYEELLKGQRIFAADGTALFERQADGSWGKDVLKGKGNYRSAYSGEPGFSYWGSDERSWKHEENWYERMRRQYLPQNSRFGELPVPEGLDLGNVTLVLSAKQPYKQVISEPIAVKPDTGYLLIFWARTSGSGVLKKRLAQVLNAAYDPESVPPHQDLYGRGEVLNAMPANYFHGAVRNWTRFELPFRTCSDCDRVIIRLPYPHPGDPEGMHNYRIWYDDLRLVELDKSVAMKNISGLGSGTPREPDWPTEAVERGFAVVPRPTQPITFENYIPTAEEIGAPIRLALAPGETDSAVILVRNLLGETIVVRAGGVSSFTSERGGDYVLHGAYGARFVTIRAADTGVRPSSLPGRLDAKRYVYEPEYLLNSAELNMSRKGGQFWMTVTVPPGTPAGEYAGEVKIERIKPAGGEASSREVAVPVILTVRDFPLEEADVAFFVWYNTPPWRGRTVNLGRKQGPASALPGAEEIYLADQRRHGMNTVVTYCYAEGQDKDGGVHIRFNELDAMVEYVRRAGLCRKHPLLLATWSRPMEIRGEASFGFLAGGESTVTAISEHAGKSGWPEILFYLSDEPVADGLAAHVREIAERDYAEPRKRGVRTATATGRFGAMARPLDAEGHTLGELYDVWIESGTGDWSELRKKASRQNAELWMYRIRGDASYRGDRFFAGLWTWRTGVKGNGVWSYGWYVRVNDSGLPESEIRWEGRLAGVNDYRYLQTLEHTIAAGERTGEAGRAVQNAKRFLDELRQRIPYTAPHGIARPDEMYSEMDLWHRCPQIRPEDFDRIQDDCARHIIAIRTECGL